VPTVVGVLDLVIFNVSRFTPALAPQVVLFALVGIPGAVAAITTLLETQVGDALRGRVFAAFTVSAFTVAEAAAACSAPALAADLAPRFSVLTVLTAHGAGYVLAGRAFAALVRRTRPRFRRQRVVRLPLGAAAGMVDPDHGLVEYQRRWNG
jgi:hypothetical protein